MSTIEELRTRMNSIRSSIINAQKQSEDLAEKVAQMTTLVDGAASRHAAWETKLAFMVESDTRRSAEVAQKQETLAAALGICPRVTSSPASCLWRVTQHILFFIGLIFSVLFVSPLSALKRWNEKRDVVQTSRLSAVSRTDRRGQLPGVNVSSRGIRVGTSNYANIDRIPKTDMTSTDALGAKSQASEASTSRVRIENLSGRGSKTTNEANVMGQFHEGNASLTLPSETHPPLVSEKRLDATNMRSVESKDANNATADPRRSELDGPSRRHLSWADRSSLLGINVEYKSDDGAETDFWKTFDS